MIRKFWVDIHYACFGIVSRNSRIIDAPPIAHWMVGLLLTDIKPFLLTRKAKVVEI